MFTTPIRHFFFARLCLRHKVASPFEYSHFRAFLPSSLAPFKHLLAVLVAARTMSGQDYTFASQGNFTVDIEKNNASNMQLRNTTVKHFVWRDITVTVKDHATKEAKALLHGVTGLVEAGTVLLLYKSD